MERKFVFLRLRGRIEYKCLVYVNFIFIYRIHSDLLGLHLLCRVAVIVRVGEGKSTLYCSVKHDIFLGYPVNALALTCYVLIASGRMRKKLSCPFQTQS